MAYTRRNFLERVLEIQAIVKEHKKKGITQKRIFKDYIETQYHISISTFNNYICINAKRELRELNEKEETVLTNK